MLKLTYTDSGLFLEYLSQSLESLVAQRSVLSTRLGQPQFVQSAYAAVPLRADVPGIDCLRRICATTPALALDGCDHHLLELTVGGTWLAVSPGSEEGVFVTELEAWLEIQIWDLWRQSLLVSGSERGCSVSRPC